MRIAIVDDEPSLVRLSCHTLSDYGKERNIDIIIDEFSSGEDFLSDYSKDVYDIIFMDVFMPGMDGIETITKLRESDPSVAVIFLTTSESHMKNALSCHAFDYLVKPATRPAFFKVMDECNKMLGEKILNASKYIELKTKGMNLKISVSQITYVVANGHTILVHTSDGSEYDSKENFSSIADALFEYDNMLLINRGVLVNMDHIDKMDEGNCYMSDGSCFAIKIKSNKAVRETYENYRLKNSAL